MGKKIIKLDNSDYLYQVNRYHNNVDWHKGGKMPVASQTPLSLDEMQERWNAYEWLIADEKHFEAKCIRHADEEMAAKRRAEAERRREREHKEQRLLESTEIKFDFLKKYI